MTHVPTASQTIGPFFRTALQRPAWSDLTRDGAAGEPVRIEGAVYDGDRAPVPDALLELWQPAVGFGRACTDVDGHYWFRTVTTPYANVSVFARGLLKRLVTRVYFADRADENARDPLLRSIADAAVRDTLIAPRSEHAGGIVAYRFDIVLQGAGETAFLTLG